MATHLVTGGAGFLGAHTARALHARGERVRVLDILPAPELPAGIEYLRADVLDAARVAEATAGVDVVHHHAALVPLTKAGRRLWRVNVDGTQQVLDAARAAGVKFFIHVSTSAVFGRPERCPITDDTPLRPLEDYGRAKLGGEERVAAAAPAPGGRRRAPGARPPASRPGRGARSTGSASRRSPPGTTSPTTPPSSSTSRAPCASSSGGRATATPRCWSSPTTGFSPIATVRTRRGRARPTPPRGRGSPPAG